MVKTTAEENLYDIVNELAIRAEESEEIRDAVLQGRLDEVNNSLKSELGKMNVKRINIDVCISSIIGDCPIDIKAKEIYTTEVIIATNSIYDPKKLKIFLWKNV